MKAPDMYRRQHTSYFIKIVGASAVLLTMVYSVYVYMDVNDRLSQAEIRVVEYEHVQQSLTSKVQVYLEQKTQLEDSLRAVQTEHEKTKTALASQQKVNDEAQNRYAALDQQYKMMQSTLEDTQSRVEQLDNEKLNLEVDKDKALEDLQRNHDIDKDQIEDEKSSLQEQLDSAESRYREAMDHISELEDQIIGLQEKVEQQQSESLTHTTVVDTDTLAESENTQTAEEVLTVKDEVLTEDKGPVTAVALPPGDDDVDVEEDDYEDSEGGVGVIDAPNFADNIELDVDDGDGDVNVMPAPMNAEDQRELLAEQAEANNQVDAGMVGVEMDMENNAAEDEDMENQLELPNMDVDQQYTDEEYNDVNDEQVEVGPGLDYPNMGRDSEEEDGDYYNAANYNDNNDDDY